MTLIQYFRLLLRNWLPIGVATLLVTAGVYLISHSRPPQYNATATEYFSLTQADNAGLLAQGSKYLQDQMSSFGELATSPIVLNGVIDDLRLQTTPKDLAQSVTAITPRNTVVMKITVGSSNAKNSADIANSVSGNLINAIDNVSPKLANGKSLVSVRTIQVAQAPAVQSAPNTKRNTAFGFVIGLLLACLTIIAIARLDNRVRTPGTLAEVTTRRMLGSIRQARNLATGSLIIDDDPRSRSAEDIRQIRANVEQLATGRTSFAAVITSSTREEGRSVVAANLATALAEVGRSTILVDADLRRPRIADITGTDGSSGLLDALADPERLAAVIQDGKADGLKVLTSGGTRTNPGELLSSKAMGEVIGQLRQHYAFVIIDSPALLDAADAAATHAHVDGILMLANARRVEREQLQNALRTADLAGLKTLGVVLNAVNPRDLPSSSTRGNRRRTAPPQRWDDSETAAQSDSAMS